MPDHAPNGYRSTAERRHADVSLNGTQTSRAAFPMQSVLSLELRFRCAIADYILNSKHQTLKDRVYDLVAGMSLDVGTSFRPRMALKISYPKNTEGTYI